MTYTYDNCKSLSTDIRCKTNEKNDDKLFCTLINSSEVWKMFLYGPSLHFYHHMQAINFLTQCNHNNKCYYYWFLNSWLSNCMTSYIEKNRTLQLIVHDIWCQYNILCSLHWTKNRTSNEIWCFFNLFSYVLKPKHSLDNICMSVSEFVINHKIKR